MMEHILIPDLSELLNTSAASWDQMSMELPFWHALHPQPPLHQADGDKDEIHPLEEQ
nr:hypothetical protein Iba_chr07cCG0340 [Ipomoea batatas]GMD18624.1 hypothetical protein Iba_chr07eCG0970 [Ipomoea batatas]